MAIEVILKEDVLGLGDIGQQVRVKPGFARNYLIPQGKAIESGSKKASVLEHHIKAIHKKKNAVKIESEKKAETLRDVEIKLSLRVASGGKVFGSITSKMIADELQKSGHDIDRRRVLLSEPIKKIGVHFVSIKLHPEVQAQVKVNAEEVAAKASEEAEEASKAKEVIEAASASKQASLEEETQETSTEEPETEES